MMGTFEQSIKRELGKNTGKFISNVVFGDMHSTPYRRIDSSRQSVREDRQRLTEMKVVAEIERRDQESNARVEMERKNQLYAIDGAVLKNIDLLNSYHIPTDKPNLLVMLSELSVQLKANKWQKSGNEAPIRNKYTDALIEKFVHCVNELQILDANDPHLEYYQKVSRKTKRARFFKKNREWLIPLIIIGSVLLFGALYFLIIFLIDYPLYFWIGLLVIFGILGYKVFMLISKKRAKQSFIQNASLVKEKTKEVVETSSPFFDLNADERIEKRLTSIWKKHQQKVSTEIMNRKPIFSADGVNDSILFVGVNPSYNPADDELLLSSKDNNSLMYGSFYKRDDAPDYFKSLEKFASKLGKGYTHINLLYAREDDRNLLLHGNSDFIREQLELSYETIMKIAPVAILFFSDYCREMIFGAERWIDPSTEKYGHYILKGTTIPVFFTDDITIIDESSKFSLSNKIKRLI